MKFLKSTFLRVVMVGCAWLIAGCGSSENVDRDWSALPDTTAQTRKSSFETRTDTVLAADGKRSTEASEVNASPVRFTVQIGSYSIAKNASAAQGVARQRYSLPVVNEYNAARRMYQIRIGFFETDAAAKEFRLQLVRDHPADYKGAWVVQITK